MIGVIRASETTLGTGFLVSTELVATCFHVLEADREDFLGHKYKFHLVNSELVVELVALNKFNKKEDVALLKILPPSEASEIPDPAVLIEGQDMHLAGRNFNTTGYGFVNDPDHNYKVKSATGAIHGLDVRDHQTLIHLQSQAILAGMSGAPVIVNELGGVIGMITARNKVNPMHETHNRDSAWAVQICHVLDLDREHLRSESVPTKPQEPTNKVINNVGGMVATDGGKIITVKGVYTEGNLITGNHPIQSEDSKEG